MKKKNKKKLIQFKVLTQRVPRYLMSTLKIQTHTPKHKQCKRKEKDAENRV